MFLGIDDGRTYIRETKYVWWEAAHICYLSPSYLHKRVPESTTKGKRPSLGAGINISQTFQREENGEKRGWYPC